MNLEGRLVSCPFDKINLGSDICMAYPEEISMVYLNKELGCILLLLKNTFFKTIQNKIETEKCNTEIIKDKENAIRYTHLSPYCFFFVKLESQCISYLHNGIYTYIL